MGNTSFSKNYASDIRDLDLVPKTINSNVLRFEILKKLGRVPRKVPVKTLLFHGFFEITTIPLEAVDSIHAVSYSRTFLSWFDFKVSHMDHRSTQSIRRMLQEQEYDEDTFGFFGGARR